VITTSAPTATLSMRQILWIHTDLGRVAFRVDTLILRQAMIRAGKRQVDVANDANLSKQMVSDIVAGRRQPSERTLLAISEVLNIDPRALLRRVANALRSADARTRKTDAA
jgi:transcriptional regulator with XRE-family HTH domain